MLRKETILLVFCAVSVGAIQVRAEEPAKAEEKKQDEKKADKVTLADGKLEMAVPEKWVRKEPQTSIVEHEFALAKADGDEADGRLTVMGAGGTVQANIDRWYGQFAEQAKGKTSKTKVAGIDVHLVDISGTFKDQRGPLAPAVSRKDYRMLVAVIDTDKLGRYFVKLTGPAKTIAAHEKEFTQLIESLKAK
ncbi:MAG: hypothetical protein WD176_06315 [Pirellulales bacterium]